MRSLRWIETALTTGVPPRETWVLLEGRSMEPAYTSGDWLLVEPLDGSRLIRPGEVVVARRGDLLVTHRVVRLRGGQVVTKGDASLLDDPPIPLGGVIGRVVAARRRPVLHRMMRRALRSIRPFLVTPLWRKQ
jgi:signal peptidase I